MALIFESKCSRKAIYYYRMHFLVRPTIIFRRRIESTSPWTPRTAIAGHYARRFLHPFEVETRVPRDVLLYRMENARFYRLLNLFALSQLFFWSYMAYFGYTSFKEIPRVSEVESKKAFGKRDNDGRTQDLESNLDEENDDDDDELLLAIKVRDVPWWRRFQLSEHRTGFAVTCTSIGLLVFFGSLFFTRRTVRALTLLRGGGRVRLECYSPWTVGNRIIEVPVDCLNCTQGRAASRGHLPLEISGHRFYFLLDMDGEFTEPQLFDHTAGLRRSWAK